MIKLNALNPLFRAMEDALKPYVDGEHYFDLLCRRRGLRLHHHQVSVHYRHESRG
jgi:hypothetical protein